MSTRPTRRPVPRLCSSRSTTLWTYSDRLQITKTSFLCLMQLTEQMQVLTAAVRLLRQRRSNWRRRNNVVMLYTSTSAPCRSDNWCGSCWHGWSQSVVGWLSNSSLQMSSSLPRHGRLIGYDWWHTHILLLLLLHPFNGLFSRTTWVSQHQTGKTSLDLNEATQHLHIFSCHSCLAMCMYIIRAGND